jgi:hypothetical protein
LEESWVATAAVAETAAVAREVMDWVEPRQAISLQLEVRRFIILVLRITRLLEEAAPVHWPRAELAAVVATQVTAAMQRVESLSLPVQLSRAQAWV